MRLQLTVLVAASRTSGGPASPVEVEVEAPSGALARELAAALATSLAAAPADPDTRGPADLPAIWVAGDPVDGSSRVGAPPLVDGAVVTLMLGPQPSPTRHPPAPRTPVALAIAHGPDAGRTVELLPGAHSLGRGSEASITIDDPRISRVHAVVTVTTDSVTVVDAGSTNGTELDGVPVGPDPHAVGAGATIAMGDSLLVLRDPGDLPATMAARGDGTLAVRRRLVQLPAAPRTSVTLPDPPPAAQPGRVSWVAVALPLPVAAVMALFFGPMMLAFAITGPLLWAGTVIGDRLSTGRRYAADHAAYLRRRGDAQERVAAACREEARARAASAPDPALTLVTATTPTARLWERRTAGAALTASVGWWSEPASLRVQRGRGADAEHPVLQRVPCTLPLGDLGMTGVCGERGAVMGALRAVLGQLVTLHSPADLQVVLVTGPGPDEAWSWLGRLPHTRGTDGHPRDGWRVRVDGTDAARARVRTLAAAVRRRATEAQGRAGPWSGALILVVLDGTAGLEDLAELVEVVEDGPAVGICVLASSSDRAGLPAGARAVLDLDDPCAPVLRLPGSAPARLVVDQVGPWWAERLSRGLAALRDATPAGGRATPPVSVALGELLGLTEDGVLEAAIAQSPQPTPHRSSVPIGQAAEGQFRIDLASDGPHVLVAGTTGAGKSELLRTLVASLAVHHRPEELVMVLIDFKGGAAFRDCASLPHVAALVTDLDEHLAGRALVSLRAELKRRERVLAAAGVADFLSYQSGSASATAPLPRLVIVIDEFRALAEELPEFIDGMVAVAALGRSLGVHLVLATQRPAGVVTADIKANMNLRIALRLRDRSDSLDVIDAPEAAALDPATPGRALARVAGGPVVAFQTAHASATDRGRPAGGLRVRRLPWGEAPEPWPEPRLVDGDRTDLEVVVAAVRSAAAATGARAAASPWLPPLPACVEATSLPPSSNPWRCPIGLVDEPALQRQSPLEVALDQPGHWGFVGGAGSGRTTALLAVAGSVTAALGPGQVHLYAVSSGSLSTVQSLPHCGAHVGVEDRPRLTRLLARLALELAHRRDALARAGHATMAEWRRADPVTAPPALLLLVDDWDLLAQRTEDQGGGPVTTTLMTTLREGAGLGLTAVLSGDRALLLGRGAAAMTRRVVLRMSDPTDLLLAGLAPRSVPADQPPGRGLLQDGTEVQLALPAPITRSSIRPGPPSGTGTAPPSPRPWRVDALPDRVSAQSWGEAAAVGEDPDDLVLVGIGGDELARQGLSPGRDGRRWAVLGGNGSGVSTTLVTIATGLLARGRRLCVVATPSAAWEPLCRDARILWCHDPGRVQALVELRRQVPELAVVVDDADRLLDTPVDAAVREVADLADRDDGLVVVGAKADAVSVQYRGLAVGVARHRTGVLLGPASTLTADLLGARAPADPAAPPGRGHLVRAGVAVPVQVASTTVR